VRETLLSLCALGPVVTVIPTWSCRYRTPSPGRCRPPVAAARFAVVCAVTGFTVSPAAGAVTALTRSSVHAGATVLVAALAGAVAVAMACTPGRARGGPAGETAAGTPVLGPAASRIMGKLTL
jgi:FtsH-binding integral membrane protein